MGAGQSTELTSEHLSCGALFVEENAMELLQLLVRLNEIEDMIESKMLEKEQEKEAREQQRRYVQEQEEQQEQEERELKDEHFKTQNQLVDADRETDHFDEFDLTEENCEIANDDDDHDNISNSDKERECQEKEEQEEAEVQSMSESVTPEFTEKEVQELLAPFQTLHFANRYLDDESILHAPIEVCRVLSRHTFLSELDLSYNQLTAQSLVPLIESLTPLQHLKRLNLSGIAPVAEISVCRVLCNWLSTNPNLTTLSLMQCKLHNEHVLCICNALAQNQNTHLKELNMMFNEFDWKGLVVLIEMLKSNTTLAILRVDSNSYLSSMEQVEEKRLLYGCTCAGYFRNGETYYNDKHQHDVFEVPHETNQKEEEESEKINSGNNNNEDDVTVNNVEESTNHQENKYENGTCKLNAPRSASAERFLARRQFLTHELHGYSVLPPDLLAQIEEILKPRREQYLREQELSESLEHQNLQVEEILEEEQQYEEHDEGIVAHDQHERNSDNDDNDSKQMNSNVLQIDEESMENASNSNKDNESSISENDDNIHGDNDHDNKMDNGTKQDRNDEDAKLYAALDETIHHYKQRMRNRNKLAAAVAGGVGNTTSFTKSMPNNNYNSNNNNKTTSQHFLPSINSKWHVASAMTQAYTYRAKHNPTLYTGKPKLLNNGFDLIKLGGITTPESYYTHNGTSVTNQHQHHNNSMVEQSMQMETEVYDDFAPLPQLQQDEQQQVERLHPQKEEEEGQQQGNSVTDQLYNKSKELIVIPNTVVNPLKCYLKPCWCDPHDASVKYGGTLHYHCKYEEYIEHNTNSKLTQTQLGSARSDAHEQQRTKRANTKTRDGRNNKPEWNATSTTRKYNANASDSGNVYHRTNNYNNSSSSTTPSGVNTNTNTNTNNLHRHESTSVFRPMGESSNKPNYARDFLHDKGQELQQQQQSTSVFASFDMADNKNENNSRPLRRTSYHGCQGTGHRCISINPNDLTNRVMSKNNITALHGHSTGGNTESKKVINDIKKQQKRQMQLYNRQLQTGNTTQAISSTTNTSSNNIINTATQYVNKDGSIAVLHYNAVNYFSAPFQSSAENLVYEGQDELAEYEKESL